ncbi:MAG: hypothetical protein PHU07_09950 [Acidocella sp.]|nr:hypothetical protein [Acidocella sp.]
MTVKDFPHVSPYAPKEAPHRPLSREPAGHGVAVAILGVVCVAGVFAVLWLLYTVG